MNYFEFYSPVKINAGDGALENLAFELSQLQIKKLFVLTDAGVKSAGIVDLVFNFLPKDEISYEVFDKVPSDSDFSLIDSLASEIKQKQVDGLLAIGGGSVIDTAKALNILISLNYKSLYEVLGVDRITGPLKPLIVIPTTIGTGSEATLVAVIKDTKQKVKLPFVSYQLVPTLTIIDPRVYSTLPDKLAVATSVDALTHAIEAFISRQKNPISDNFAIAAIKTIYNALKDFINNQMTLEQKAQLALAATMAGIAFSNAMVGAVHAIGHALGAVSNIHHGTAMGLLLPEILRWNALKVANLYSELLLHLNPEIYLNTSAENRPMRFISLIEDLIHSAFLKVELPLSLSSANVEKSDLKEIADLATKDGSLLTNPVELFSDDIELILKKLY